MCTTYQRFDNWCVVWSDALTSLFDYQLANAWDVLILWNAMPSSFITVRSLRLARPHDCGHGGKWWRIWRPIVPTRSRQSSGLQVALFPYHMSGICTGCWSWCRSAACPLRLISFRRRNQQQQHSCDGSVVHRSRLISYHRWWAPQLDQQGKHVKYSRPHVTLEDESSFD